MASTTQMTIRGSQRHACSTVVKLWMIIGWLVDLFMSLTFIYLCWCKLVYMTNGNM